MGLVCLWASSPAFFPFTDFASYLSTVVNLSCEYMLSLMSPASELLRASLVAQMVKNPPAMQSSP